MVLLLSTQDRRGHVLSFSFAKDRNQCISLAMLVEIGSETGQVHLPRCQVPDLEDEQSPPDTVRVPVPRRAAPRRRPQGPSRLGPLRPEAGPRREDKRLSLEGVLLDLRTTTIDNHDAEAFLKPVSRSEVPDYYDVIRNPMDLQTMLKKVKQRQYKHKAEFKADLDLIWNNCFTYNAVESHPLRACATRLRIRANRLLANVTDRKERQDPRVPGALLGVAGDVQMSKLIKSPPTNGVPAHANGIPTVNGVNGIHPRAPTITIRPQRKSMSGERMFSSSDNVSKRLAPQIPFENMPALVRSAEGMRAFMAADDAMDSDPDVLTPYLPQHRNNCHPLSDEVRVKTEDPDNESMSPEPEVVGEKRRWNGTDALGRPRKRSRQEADPNDWWTAVGSDVLLANGLPHIPHSSYRPPPQPSLLASSKTRSKKGKGKAAEEKTMLGRMNNNIRTMRRLRDTHARFAALGLGNTGGPSGPEDEQQPQQPQQQPGIMPPPPLPPVPPPPIIPVEVPLPRNEVDDRPWGAEVGLGLTPKQWRKRRRKEKARGVVVEEWDEEIEVGSENAEQCMQWMGSKLLEHAGFQGTSKVALDVISTVASEYLLNVGRTLRYLSDKHSRTMTPEEIILHTLFESGVSHVNELERYVRDDVERYGSRLGDLEKKIDSVYTEFTAGDVINDDTLFEEDEENDGALTLGDFAEALGEDYLGLRELGIAAEFGMSNLSIPKKLLRRRRALQGAAAAPAPPPLPYPLPPPFIPLIRAKVEDQIGLLQNFYIGRFTALAEAGVAAAEAAAASAALPPPMPLGLISLSGPTLPSLHGPSLLLPPLPGPSLPPLPGPTLLALAPPPGPKLPTPTPTPTATPPPSVAVPPPPPPSSEPMLPTMPMSVTPASPPPDSSRDSLPLAPATASPSVIGVPIIKLEDQPPHLQPTQIQIQFQTPAQTPTPIQIQTQTPDQPAPLPLPPPAPAPPRPPVRVPPTMILPDDPPTAMHTKMGPLGQIMLPGAKAFVATKKKVGDGKDKDKDKDKEKDKKKGKEKDGSPKKKKSSAPSSGPPTAGGSASGGGSASPSKKKAKSDAALMAPPPLPMPIVAVGI
uniref:SAGA complex protein n=1 Tax=Mycena chlorophos TaxID=658473 RepID=A0ABQ0L6B7_MYCCL|nr:SAGA complex protein [Mycena chlorophos]